MREVTVYCGDVTARPKARTRGVLALDVDAHEDDPARVNLGLSHITRRMVEDLPDRLADLLEIACYVYCADQFVPRDTELMPRTGAHWRRSFSFRVAVRDLEFWEHDDVRSLLASTLGFLSEDRFSFAFEPSRRRAALQRHLDLREDGPPSGFDPDRVVLFSGGLDSFAGSLEAVLGRDERVVLVSHHASNVLASKQNGLVEGLRERARRGRVFHVGVVVNKGGEEAADFTQRTRSFLFATLGFVVARLFRKAEVAFFENGVVSLNLPLAAHVVGARATRTTHPRVLRDFGRLFAAAAERGVRVANPYFWMTKADVVARIAELDCAALIPATFSCANVREATRLGRHCGRCSQCLDRRFGVVAAGSGAEEPAGHYALDILRDRAGSEEGFRLAEAYVLTAHRLATIGEASFLAQFGEVYRAVPFLELPQAEAASRLHDLHVRHGKAVVKALEQADPTSFLAGIVRAPAGHGVDPADPAELEATPSDQAAVSDFRPLPRPIRFEVDAEAKRVVFEGGPELKGSFANVVLALLPEFEQDVHANRAPEEFRFVKAERLAQRMGLEEPALRQALSRMQTSLRKQFEASLGVALAADDVVQNRKWQGYRLNPYLAKASLRVLDPPAASPSGDVTTFSADVATRRPASR